MYHFSSDGVHWTGREIPQFGALKCIDAAERIAPNSFRVKRMVGSRARLKKRLEKRRQPLR